MDMDFKVAEVTLQYRPICKKQGKVISSEEAWKSHTNLTHPVKVF